MVGHANPNKPPIEERRAQRRAAEIEANQPRPIAEDWRERSRRHFSDEQKADIMHECLERMIAGQSMAQMGKLPHFPNAARLLEWFMSTHDARSSYVRAREICAEVFAQEIVAISDDLTEDPNSRRIRIEARKWVAAKLLPKTYGDRIEIAETGKTVPSGHLVGLVETSDSAADAMLLLETAIDAAGSTVLENEPVLSAAAEATAAPAEQKKAPGPQGTRG